MSWQSYTDNLVNTGKLDSASLYGVNGDLWATTNLNVSSSEINSISTAFSDPASLQSHGLFVNGEKYFLLKADQRSIYGKLNATGIIAVKTIQTIIIAHYPDGVQPGEAVAIVEKLADYLIGSGY